MDDELAPATDDGEVVAAGEGLNGDGGRVQVVVVAVGGGRQVRPDAKLDDPVEGCCAD